MKILVRPTAREAAAFSGVNLLILLALALCGLVGWQWIRETRLFNENRKLKEELQQEHQTNHQQQKAITELQNEITRIENERRSSAAINKTNQAKIAELARDLNRAENEARSHSNKVTYYKVAFESATNQVAIANANTSKANEIILSMRKAVEDRNDIALRLNELNKKFGELMTERNEIVDKFSAFVKEVENERKRDGGKK